MAFLDKDFLLEGETSKALYHTYASNMPIIDYHCHIDPAEICENRRFSDLSEVWLSRDHYKWRLMRACGIDERYITGQASGWEKFRAFAGVLPGAVGNPVYQWSHLELLRFFGCERPLCPSTANMIWDMCNEQLNTDENLRVRGIIRHMRVDAIITTDDPVSDLSWHRKLAADDSFTTEILPGWRPDAALNIRNNLFPDYIRKLGDVAHVPIADYNSLKAALFNRMEYFSAAGCRSCDHGIHRLPFLTVNDKQINEVFLKRLRGESLSPLEADMFRCSLLRYLTAEYSRRDWVMELHLGVLRDVNTSMYDKLGPDSGFDCIDPWANFSGLIPLFDSLERAGSLPKTLLYSINPNDNAALNTVARCFGSEGVKSKIQQGSAWWFNDSLTGMEQQITAFAEGGLLAHFTGMLTDSRSFLSYTRHEYFRRILCRLLGKWVDAGLYPRDMDILGQIVWDVCYNNTRDFFGLGQLQGNTGQL